MMPKPGKKAKNFSWKVRRKKPEPMLNRQPEPLNQHNDKPFNPKKPWFKQFTRLWRAAK